MVLLVPSLPSVLNLRSLFTSAILSRKNVDPSLIFTLWGLYITFFFLKGYYARISGLINISHVGSDPRLIHTSALACDLHGCFWFDTSLGDNIPRARTLGPWSLVTSNGESELLRMVAPWEHLTTRISKKLPSVNSLDNCPRGRMTLIETPITV